MKWVLQWFECLSESHGKDVYDSKEEAKDYLEKLQREYGKENMEWEIRKAQKVWG